MIHKINELSDHVLYEFLSYCMSPVPERIKNECMNYRTNVEREMYGIFVENKLVGITGLIRGQQEIEVKHLAIHPVFRKQGLGRELLHFVLESNDTKLIVETDKEAVNFYEKIGFTITSLGEKYPGVERFLCEHRPATEY
ncbi:GNAT family N-acetyltransferase [Paenibacillus vini]|uniref:GNAT family N-acetyltransferase n=1 Tax=Paenibacillus vini TaxID=1476024 RepID=UPI0025B63D93|nr:GNAT family N-acetyltransferase [Paenibacillus vini]MDN4070311.1 GNAT family N-acetyltransferase [Paenibacillus vini]